MNTISKLLTISLAMVLLTGMAQAADLELSTSENATVQTEMSEIHSGTVTTHLVTGQYSYIEINEDGGSIWICSPKVEVKIGDKIEFPHSPPSYNFESESLNKMFEIIYFASNVKIVR